MEARTTGVRDTVFAWLVSLGGGMVYSADVLNGLGPARRVAGHVAGGLVGVHGEVAFGRAVAVAVVAVANENGIL